MNNRKKWRASRLAAGIRCKYCKFVHMPLKRLRFFRNEGYEINSMGLCYQRCLKLRLGSRKICVAKRIVVIVRGGRVNDPRT